MISLDLASGRFFNGSESSSGSPVAIVGYDIAMNLFGSEEVLGRKLKVAGQRVEIIGTFTHQGESMISNG